MHLSARLAVCVVLIGSTLAPAQPAGAADPIRYVSADAILHARPIDAHIVNGVLAEQYPTVGALLFGSNPDSAITSCSGTLIGCETFLTAGHCVADDPVPGHYLVFLPHAGFFPLTRIAVSPDYGFPVGDVAVLKLAAPVAGIAATAINTTAAPAPGATATIVGFGRSGGNNDDYGIMRAGSVTTSACTGGISDTTSICWEFRAPLGPAGADSNTCNGDSGGPLFIAGAAGLTVAGITSGGNSSDCLPNDLGFDARVSSYQSFIETEGGADLAYTACGEMPQVGDAHTQAWFLSGLLDAGAVEGRHAFAVPSGTTLLRVAMNAIDDGASDFNLYVKANAPPSPADYDCRWNGSGQYAFCEFTAPAAGTWHFLVNRVSGSGTYQSTVTLFGTDCSAPGNEGLPCDDSNACTATDHCQAGACMGSPVGDGTPCEDGTACTEPDRCQAGVCTGTAVADDTPCNDGDPCTQPDLCHTGSCGGSAPALYCAQPFVAGKSFVMLKDNAVNTRDRLVWRWLRGSQAAKADFGSPTTTTDYTLCVYDASGGLPQLMARQAAPAGANWREMGTGYTYRDSKGAGGALRRIVLREGADGRAKITVRGKGTGLELGLLESPLQQQDTVTVQLLNGTDCWEARYSTNVLNQDGQFRARAD